jgi:DNA-binding XRE family transcriptional regulator
MRYYDFEISQILIINCETADNAFALESIIHKACEGKRVPMPYDGGTEFFSATIYAEAVKIAHSVCSINGFQSIPFIRERTQDLLDETHLIVEAFAAKIRARRLELNLSQEEVAKLSGLSKRTIERIENNGQATFYNMVAALRTLNLEYLFAELEMHVPLRKRATKSKD